jgi:hypothetical protein
MSDWIRVRYPGGDADPDPASEPTVGSTVDFVRGPMQDDEWMTGTGKVRGADSKADGRTRVSVDIPVIMTQKFTAFQLDEMGLDVDSKADQIVWRYTEDSPGDPSDDDE